MRLTLISMHSHTCAGSQDHHGVTHLTRSAVLVMRHMHITGAYLDADVQAAHEEAAKQCGVNTTPRQQSSDRWHARGSWTDH